MSARRPARGRGDRGGLLHIGHRFADDRCLWSEHPDGCDCDGPAFLFLPKCRLSGGVNLHQMQIIGRQGRGCTPCGCPLHSHRSRGEAPMTRGSAGVYILDPLRVAEGGGKVRHPCGVEVKTSIFPQVIAAIAARPVAKKRGSLAGSGIPLCYRLPFAHPCRGAAHRSDKSDESDKSDVLPKYTKL